MLAFPGIEAIQARKRELLLESELNRRVLHLELHQVGLRFDALRQHWVGGPWKIVAGLAGLVLALRMKKMKRAVGSSVGLYLLRWLLDFLSRSRAGRRSVSE